jgi:imidazolonepropionase-like amidohydrolase
MPRAALASLILCVSAIAQGPPPNGPRTVATDWWALEGAMVVRAPGQPPTALTLVVREGRIQQLDGPVPDGATRVDCRGLTILPAFVEPFLAVDVPALDPATGDRHWHPMLQPERSALESPGVPTADREALWRLGFATAAMVPSGGILKGTAAVVQLDAPVEGERARVLRNHAFELASAQLSRDGHPNSEMGAIALLRQTLADARWFERSRAAVTSNPALAPDAPQSRTLQALADHWQLPLWFDAQDELQALRAHRIAAEFGRSLVVVGSGMEFRRSAALAATKAAVVVPLAFPEAPDVSSAAAAEQVSLRHLQTWEQAPTNAKRLLDAGLRLAFTSARLRDRAQFHGRLRDAMACGISADQALAALTTVPAQLLGIDNLVGTIEVGKVANLLLVAGEPFRSTMTVRELWIGGRRQIVTPPTDRGLDGTWNVSGLPDLTEATLSVQGNQLALRTGDTERKVESVQREPSRVSFRLPGDPVRHATLWAEGDALAGQVQPPAANGDGTLAGTRTKGPEPKAAPEANSFVVPDLGPLPVPLGGYGTSSPAPASTFAIVGADLWTCDARGIVRNGAVLVREGKLAYVGPREGLPPLPADVPALDAAGKHLTPGLIDCHSHTGISRGVNESGEAVTAEVRVQDVIDPDDVNWYRQLAGGVTAVNQLHGSANAIGGQSSTVKLRWGALHPDDMRYAQAPEGIKFALGENPRRANGSGANSRYPNTRMGVEALLRDRFAAATAYRAELAAYEALPPTARARLLPPRRDLELEALAEVLAGTRRIHCHSYRQDEIGMLAELARQHGFVIGTFQHVLEGYKVADLIAKSAIGASSFSDWWAYKFEVFDAIPENGAILHEAGVLVSFNSDSNEHARRLNTEAGKAVKYGRVPPADALCFVTRNPAIQLGIFDRTGSLAAGKDADLALWSGDPLAYSSRCEATWVDGRLLFSLDQDRSQRQRIAAERQRLLAKAARSGGKSEPPPSEAARRQDAYWRAEHSTNHYCCDCQGGR